MKSHVITCRDKLELIRLTAEYEYIGWVTIVDEAHLTLTVLTRVQ